MRGTLVGIALASVLAGCDSLAPSFSRGSWSAVAPGDVHTCALTDAAAVSCWGANDSGQLGSPTVGTDSRRPISLLLGPIGVAAVSSGVSMSCARLGDDRALCWGAGTPSPVEVAGGRRFRQVAVGSQACGLTTAGEIWCWTTPVAAAIQVAGNFSAGEIGAGWDRACALKPADGIWCWTYAAPVASQVSGTAGVPYHGLTMGDFHGCALGADGIGSCWGSNTLGQLGDGTYNAKTTPTPIVQGDRNAGDLFTSLRAYAGITCGVTVGHRGYCWGQGANRPAVTPGITSWSELAPGANHVCGFAVSDDALYCYGANDRGQLGNGTRLYGSTPGKVIDP